MFIVSLLASFGLYYTVQATCDLTANPCPSPCFQAQGNCVSPTCTAVFTPKLGDSTTNPFSGNISYVEGTVDLLITLSYTDPNFSDSTKKGIVIGENSDSCLSIQLWRYQDSSYTIRDQSQYTIKYADDGSSKRSYQFTIPSKDFVSQLQLSDDGTSFNFKGFYSYEFSIGTNLQSVVYFDFASKILRTSTGTIDTSFGSLSSSQTLSCGGSCTLTAQSKIQFCSDETCATPSDTYSLYLNDQVWIKQSLTTIGTEGYYLKDAQIYYTGDKLFKPATIVLTKNSQAGYAMYLIKITIAWTPVSITVNSTLSSSARFLATTYTSSTSTSSEIACVKNKDTNQCITCDQTKNVDNSDLIPSDGCPTDSSSGSNLSIISILLMLTMIFIQ